MNHTAVRQILAGVMIYFITIFQVLGQAALLPNAEQQYFNNNGQPLASGSVTYYVPGTTQKKTTWQNSGQTINNTNPVALDIGGKGIMYGQGSYRQVVQDSLGNVIWDQPTTAYGASSPTGATGTDTAPVGTVMAYTGFTVPTNWALAYGQALSRTTFAALKTAITISATSIGCTNTSTTLTGFTDTSLIRIGAPIEATCLPTSTTVASITNATTIVVSQAAAATATVTATIFPWGNGDQVSTFNVPDMRGRSAVGADCMGYVASGNACASNLTTSFYGANPGAAGQLGGTQAKNLTIANLNSFTPTINSITPAGSIVSTLNNPNGFFGLDNAGGTFTLATGGAHNDPSISADVTVTSTFTGTPVTPTMPALGSGTAHSVVNPDATVNYIIKVAANSTGAGGVVSFGGMFGDIVCASTLTCAPIGLVNTVGCTTATNSQIGCVQPDGTSITISGGVISAVVGGSLSIGTPIGGGTNGNILYINGAALGQLSQIPVANGGTGLATITAHCVMLGEGTSNVGCLNGSGGNSSLPLISQGASLDPVYSQLGLAGIVAGSQDTLLGNFNGSSITAGAVGNCLNALTYSTSTHTFGCNTTAGTGTVTSVGTGQGLSGGAIVASGTLTTSTGVPTNTLSSKTANYTIATGDCGKNIQAGTGSTGWFTITVPSVSGFASDCTVTITNGDTGRAKFFSGLTGFTWLMPTQAIEIQIVNGGWTISNHPPQWAPAASVTLFVDESLGSASNDCLAAGSGNACTEASAMAMLTNNINNINNVIIQWPSAATLTTQFKATSYNGPGSVTLDGNTSAYNPSSAPGGCSICIGAANGSGVNGIWQIRRFTMANSASGIYGIVCAHSSCVLQDGMQAFTLTGASFYSCTQGGNCVCQNNITVTGTAMLHLFDQSDSSVMKCRNITITISGSLVTSGATVNSHGGGLVDVVGVTWTVSGSITGQRYFADLLGLIDSGACNSIAGSTAGTPTAGTLGSSGGYCN